MFIAKFWDVGPWRVSRCYQRKPGNDLNGSVTADPIIETAAPPVAILAFLFRASIVGKGTIIPRKQRIPETVPSPQAFERACLFSGTG